MLNYNLRKPIYGVGINDSDYATQPRDRSKRCPVFDRWHSMIRRCYSENSLTRSPAYEMVSVCQEWLVFSNFKAWMELQDWEGLALDKDIIGDGNLYSPKTCRFVPARVNSFYAENTATDFPGVRLKFTDGRENPYIAQAMVDGHKKHLGVFSSLSAGHIAWQTVKVFEIDSILLEYPSLNKDIVKVLELSRKAIELDMHIGKITRRLK